MNPTPCKLCGGQTKIAYAGIFDDRYGFQKTYDLYQCLSCGSFITEPPLKADEIGPLYTNYYPRRDIDPQKVKIRARSFNPGSSRASLGEHRAHRFLPKATRAGIKVLDVGCGDGSSLLELETLGYEAYGIETDANVAKVRDALGLKIHIGMIEDAPFEKHSFDYVIANQVIEHVVDVDSFLTSIKKMLKPDGTAIFSTPNAQSIFRTLYGRRWIHWHIPYHQQVFSPQGLEVILHENGLETTQVQTTNPASWTMHELNRLRLNPKPGEKNPFWNSSDSGGDQNSQIKSSFVGKVTRRLAFYGLQTLGAVATSFKGGNCLIVWAKPSSNA